jgi:hypothetical protein
LELAGVDSSHLLEYPGKIVRIAESQFIGYLFYGEIALSEQILRFPDSEGMDIGTEVHSEFTLKNPTQIGRAETGYASQIL